MANIAYETLETLRATITCLQIDCALTASLNFTGTRTEIETLAQNWDGPSDPDDAWADGYCPDHRPGS